VVAAVCHEKAEPPAAAGGSRSGPPKPQTDSRIVADPTDQRQRQARKRIRHIEEHRRVCTELEWSASLVQYYGPRTPRPIPLGRFLVEGWWAA